MIIVSEVTCWYTTDDLRVPYVFNHIEDGYSPDRAAPTPHCDYQRKAWSNKFWRSTCGALANGRVFEDSPGRTLERSLEQAYDRTVWAALTGGKQ